MGNNKSILEYILFHADHDPDKLAVADIKSSISYGGLLRSIKSVASYLMKNGLARGDVVGIRATQEIDFVAAFYGVQYMGGIACPIEKTASAERTQEILNQVSAACMLEANQKSDICTNCLILSDACNYPVDVVSMADLSEKEVSNIIFTTGTTGKSKGILISYQADKAIAENVIDSVEMKENEVELITSPCNHSLAIRRINTAMLLGSTAILTQKYMLYDNLWGIIEKYGVTAITFVPSVLKLVLEVYKDKISEYDAQLNYVQISSAPLYSDLQETLHNLLPTTRLYNIYGTTESGCTLSYEFSRFGCKTGCIGRPTINTVIHFEDKERDKYVDSIDEETAGYLAFEGNMNMVGYLADADQTEKVLKNGIVHTNDIGYMSEGFVYILGREGEVINCGGLKVCPDEIEQVANRIDGISDSACVPMVDKIRGEVPVLYIETASKGTKDISEKEVKEYLKRYLEDYKVPVRVKRIDKIPRTFNGKIMRRKLMDSMKEE